MKRYILLLATAVAITASSCIGGVRGNGHVVSKDFNESNFRNLEVGAAMKVYIRQGNTYEVKIKAEENILELIQVKKDGDKLEVSFRDHQSIHPTKDILVYITAPDFHELSASGSGGYVSEGVIKTNDLSIDLSGATKVKLDLDVTDIKIDASGASEIRLAGKTNSLKVEGSGSTDIRAFGLEAQDVAIDLSGAGSAEVQAAQKLDVDLSGAGSVRYKGNPAVSQDISGAGTVKQAN